MKFSSVTVAGTVVLLLLMILPGCQDAGETGGSTDEPKTGAAGPATESPEAVPGGATTAAQGNNPTASQPSSAGQSSATPTPVPSEKYTAKITRIDKAKDASGRYNMEVTFNSAQGRNFVVRVLTDKTGAAIFTETVKSVPDYYYSHTTSFSHTGALSELKAQVTSEDGSKVLDTWDL